MTLMDKIQAIYPELKENDFVEIIVMRNDSDGKGDYIAEWNHPTLPKPTAEQLG